MNQEIFKSERYFTFYDYFISHRQLLLRSSKGDNYNTNIDIVFYDVKYVQIISSLDGVSVKKVSDKKSIIRYESVNTSLDYDTNNLFEVQCKNEYFYIGASYFKVFENQYEFNETNLNLLKGKGEKELTRSY